MKEFDFGPLRLELVRQAAEAVAVPTDPGALPGRYSCPRISTAAAISRRTSSSVPTVIRR